MTTTAVQGRAGQMPRRINGRAPGPVAFAEAELLVGAEVKVEVDRLAPVGVLGPGGRLEPVTVGGVRRRYVQATVGRAVRRLGYVYLELRLRDDLWQRALLDPEVVLGREGAAATGLGRVDRAVRGAVRAG